MVCLTKELAKKKEKRLIWFIEKLVQELAHYGISFELIFYHTSDRPKTITSAQVKTTIDELSNVPLHPYTSEILTLLRTIAEEEKNAEVVYESFEFRIVCQYLGGAREIAFRFTVEEQENILAGV